MNTWMTSSTYPFTFNPLIFYSTQDPISKTKNLLNDSIIATITTLVQDNNSSRTYNFNNITELDLPKTAKLQGIQQQECTFQHWTQQDNQPGAFRIFTIISVLFILVVLVVVGNLLVIIAVCLRRRLRSATGILILSLAVADLMVGFAILPFSIANEVLNSYWIFGEGWCTAWLTLDIWMCTASIYNLVAISIDRYIAIIKPLNYPMLITKFRAKCIVAIVWIGSFIICSPSFLLASTNKSGGDNCRCTPSNSGYVYIIFSASSSFYLPMIVVIFVYTRIYYAACAATKSVYSGMMQVTASANKNPKTILMQNPSALSRTDNLPILRVHRGSAIKNTPPFEPIRINSGSICVPISINNSLPTVYAQMNDNKNSLQFNKKTIRRHSEDPPICDNTIVNTIKGSPNSCARRSTGNIQPNLLNDSATNLIEENMDNIAFDLSFPIHSQPISLPLLPISRPGSVISLSEQEKQRWFYGYTNLERENKIIEEAKENQENSLPLKMPTLHFSNGNTTSPSYNNSSNEEDKNKKKSTEDISLIVKPETNITPLIANNTENYNLNNYKNEEKNSPFPSIKTSFLHPNSAKKSIKKRRYGANMLTRIMRRGPRKKAGCAYEKRLSLEIKAAKTVAIVTGCFIFCWLGFSILYGLSFMIQINEVVWSIVFWLGYLNSALNPVIYTVFNREFRTCFKRLLTCNLAIFGASRSQNATTMLNSYNSQLRSGKPHGYSTVSAQPYYNTNNRHSNPTIENSEES